MEIINYPDYLIYNDGRIYNKKFERFLTPQQNSNGYYQIGLCKNSKQKFFYLHRLLGIHYIDNPENKPTVDHIDVNPSNNHLSNLQWATRSEQELNKKKKSNTNENYITINKIGNNVYYKIQKQGYFSESLSCKKYNLDDAINLRDSLLSM